MYQALPLKWAAAERTVETPADSSLRSLDLELQMSLEGDIGCTHKAGWLVGHRIL